MMTFSFWTDESSLLVTAIYCRSYYSRTFQHIIFKLYYTDESSLLVTAIYYRSYYYRNIIFKQYIIPEQVYPCV